MYETALTQDARLDPTQQELLDITWRMLEAIHTGVQEPYAVHR